MAYRLLLDFRSDLQTKNWDAVLHAALTHDHGWMEWDEAELDQNGEPANFLVGTVEKSIRLCHRTVDLATYQCPEAGILVARHVEELYGPRSEPELAGMVEVVRQRRLDLMGRIGWTPEQVERDYAVVLWADSASLVLAVDDPEFVSSLDLALHGREYLLEQRSPGQWSLSPWPYQVERLELGADTLRVPRGPYARAEELREALGRERPVRRTWVLLPG